MRWVGMGDNMNVGSAAQDLRVNRPFRMPASVARELVAVEIHQHEVRRTRDLSQADAVAFHPKAPLLRIAKRQVPERHVAMPLQFENPAAASQARQ
jgi:hypothetical protein